MTLAVVFRRAARLEFDDAAMWYEERRSGLGESFIAEIDRAIAVASADPQRFPIMHRDIRCVRVRRFPYSVFLRAESSRIVVLAVFHARRDPAVWHARV
jgi:plasmid stabilization system protein ParE